ncbi:DASH family cryptochrome [Catenovulum sp. SM1970]|uniref:DASH family cryptochrome n=1 Tax=Marinifaba aquimaris TaxID=2741323 RepID=UPI00157218FB|nr:DASH family cryptochrome [Marinifaba aquimaris]NTS76268.1 DASH family cryptochrome [Marinifaba aquimaris]
MAHARGLFLFSNDLRVQDNQALALIASKVARLDCLYIINPNDYKPNRYTCQQKGHVPSQFLLESLHQLDEQLALFGQDLKVLTGDPLNIINRYIDEHQIDYVAMSRNSGVYEHHFEQSLAYKLREQLISVDLVWQHTLFQSHQLPFELQSLPASFSAFRRKVEKVPLNISQSQKIVSLPQSISLRTPIPDLTGFGITPNTDSLPFEGGCSAGLKHLNHYFSTRAPSSYKETRNALDDWSSSTKFSPWLALGCVSVRQIWHLLAKYESQVEANDSTYWIKFELLWREYFHWYTAAHQNQVFKFSGLSDNKPLTSFNGERFAKWCAGNTPYPLVNAIMHQLNETGFISNRARQIAASCWINEMQGDWRYGAAYFQQQLIDHDVASNWGNWQYIAGVGADPRGGRWFNLNKQTEQFDPDHRYIERWRGQVTDPNLDSVDIDDWPIAEPAQCFKSPCQVN